METGALAAEQEMDFSLLALFARATLTVQAVMLMLLFASVWSWAIIIHKHIAFRAARQGSEMFLRAFWSGGPLDDLYARVSPAPRSAVERVFVAGMEEWERSHRPDGDLIAGADLRIDRAMNAQIAKEADTLNRYLPFLATVGSTAPFVGLFGTVWGIKHSFEQIAISQNTNLAVVAPGIAEALLATGIGLVAAIPAVIFYNKLSSDSDRILGDFEAFADGFAGIVSRQLDR
jgi:biopolymer transport protein TolQ